MQDTFDSEGKADTPVAHFDPSAGMSYYDRKIWICTRIAGVLIVVELGQIDQAVTIIVISEGAPFEAVFFQPLPVGQPREDFNTPRCGIIGFY